MVMVYNYLFKEFPELTPDQKEKDWLHDQHVVQNKSVMQIAEEIEQNPNQLRFWIDFHQLGSKVPCKHEIMSCNRCPIS
jgi:transposase-like protein